jgi:hypothetical protein
MRMAQGNTRAKPDGFLHLWNFAATKKAGMAGALFNYVLTERQCDIVEAALIELSEKGLQQPAAIFNDLHDTWRFRKEFLEANFKPVLYGTFKLIRKNAAELMALKVNREYLATAQAKVTFPAFS